MKADELHIEETVPGIWTVILTKGDGSTTRKTIGVPDGTTSEEVLAHIRQVFKEHGCELGTVEKLA